MRHFLARTIACIVACAVPSPHVLKSARPIRRHRHRAAFGAGRHSWTLAGHMRIGIQNQPNTLNPILVGKHDRGDDLIG